jgi:hypothetical protein
MQRHFAKPSTGQIKSGIQYHIKLSIPAVTFATHALPDAILF